ncbi:type VI secretion system baseplate subunit TssG [Dyadobacter sp. 32]|uniref:type VI secretion system baseplate subunit TssG n=1 Tax=Dyadobacter sp. 32 TaxID=538966 RepID=UPI0011EC39DC
MDITTDHIKEILAQLPVKRLRAEAILAELFEAGVYRPGDVVISPESSSSLFYERDVSEIEEIFNPFSGRSWFKLNTPRDGIFDSLPEGLFHKPTPRLKNNEDWAEIRSEETRQEEDARRFFLPFDNALNQQRVRVEQFEKKALEGRDKNFIKEFLLVFWPAWGELELSEEQQFSLFHLTIIAHQVAGNVPWMESCISQMLGYDIRLFYEDQVYRIPVAETFGSLGEIVLGVDAILATNSFPKWRRLKIRIGPLYYEQMRDFFPGRSGEKLLHFLCSLLIPVEVDWDLELIPKVKRDPDEEVENSLISFTVNNNDKYAVLGYTTVL